MKTLLALALALIATAATACDTLYISPIAVSKHWAGSGWNEIHPGLTAECRRGRAFAAIGRMRNSYDRNIDLASLGAVLPFSPWLGLRVGLILGRYDNTYNSPAFAAPIAALTIGDGRALALDIMHVPANGFSPVPVTLLAARWKMW